MQTSIAPLMLAGPLAKVRDLAHPLGNPMYLVSDDGHSAGRRLRDYSDFGYLVSQKIDLLIECGQHWERASADTSLQTTFQFLRACDAVGSELLNQHIVSESGRQIFIEMVEAVTIETKEFEFV